MRTYFLSKNERVTRKSITLAATNKYRYETTESIKQGRTQAGL